MQPELKFSVSEFVETLNQTLDFAYAGVTIVGEVSSFKVNQGKWVFFDLKDEESVLNCFMSIYNLRTPLEDGMKVAVRGVPKLTKWGRFSFTVQNIIPVGEGSIKKSFELLKKKLEKEGLFAPEKKRPLPENLEKIGVISSPQAAGYADFIKILDERWGGLEIKVAKTQVQGMVAADQIIRALKYFNERNDVQIIAIIRGGGSADDLAVFNDENLVRTISASKIPIITGIGHEVDESLSDLAADIVGSTPSNVAQIISKDKKTEVLKMKGNLESLKNLIFQKIEQETTTNKGKASEISRGLLSKIAEEKNRIGQIRKTLMAFNPESVLKQGYAIISGNLSPGNVVKITTFDKIIETEVKNVRKRDDQ